MAKNDQTALLLLGGVGLAIWVAMRKKSPGDDGLDTVPGGVVLAGTIEPVTVSSSQTARMGRHLTRKEAGALISVGITFGANVKDSAGGSKIWDYMVSAQLGHNTLFGWKNAQQLGFPVVGSQTEIHTNKVGPTVAGTTMRFTAPADNNQEWDVQVKLFAKKPDATGITPRTGTAFSDWQEVARGEHPGAVLTGGEVRLSGSVDVVEVFQRHGHRGSYNILLRRR